VKYTSYIDLTNYTKENKQTVVKVLLTT